MFFWFFSKWKTTKLVRLLQTSKHFSRLLNRLELFWSLFLPLFHSYFVIRSIVWIVKDLGLPLTIDGLILNTFVFRLYHFLVVVKTIGSVDVFLLNLCWSLDSVIRLFGSKIIRNRVSSLWSINIVWRFRIFKLGLNQSWWFKIVLFSVYKSSNLGHYKLCFHIYQSQRCYVFGKLILSWLLYILKQAEGIWVSDGYINHRNFIT